MHLHWYTEALLSIIAFIAAIVDTVAGGGGLITAPALLIAGINPIFALGTIKLQASVAEFSSSYYFFKKAKIDYKVLLSLALYTMIFASCGVIALKFMPIKVLEKLIPFFLLAILIYYVSTLRRKNIYKNEVIEADQKKFLLLSSMIGFYNGFFGPGTGSIWAVLLMKTFKLNLQKATIYAKPLNFVGNLAALGIFLYNRDVMLQLALLMSIAAFIGARVGGMVVLYQNIRVLKITFLVIMLFSVTATFLKFY